MGDGCLLKMIRISIGRKYKVTFRAPYPGLRGCEGNINEISLNDNAAVAQLVEQGICNAKVPGSTPGGGTKQKE